MRILSAMGIKIIRTYNVHLKEASNVLEAISQLKKEDQTLYVMLGAWIDCKMLGRNKSLIIILKVTLTLLKLIEQ
jgi:hypothetical protein